MRSQLVHRLVNDYKNGIISMTRFAQYIDMANKATDELITMYLVEQYLAYLGYKHHMGE